jgi:uncharacterized protein (TIGR03083 family)
VADIGGIYRDGRERVSGVVESLDDEDAARPVPACPGWTVHDVIAHLAGACTDSLAGRLEGVTTAAWADAQVAERRDRTLAELLDEWRTSAPPLEEHPERIPGPLQTIWVLDLTTHEHDIRGALGRPGARASEGVRLGLDRLIGEGLRRGVEELGIGPLVVRTPERQWTIGGPEAAVACVEASAFELFRALTGRRSPVQIANFGWSVDPAPYLPAFQFGTFTTRITDLVE